jgi:hypothetical protein
MIIRLSVIIAISVVSTVTSAKAYFAIDQRVDSPDGKVEAKISDWWHLQLTDKRTGKVIFPTSILPPVLSIQWLGDSEAMVVMEHLSGGALTFLVEKSGTSHDAFPPDRAGGVGSFRRVVEEKLHWNKADITYKIGVRLTGIRCRFWTCSFEVDDTGLISHIKTHAIDEKTYLSLPSFDKS